MIKAPLFVLIISCLMTTGIFAQETGSSQAAVFQDEMADIRKKMDDLVKSEAALRDRQTSRIMKLEEDIESLRQDLGRQIAEAEQFLSQEQSILREFIEIINTNISELKTVTDEHEAGLEALESGLQNTKQSLAGIMAFQEQTENKFRAADEKIAAFESSISQLTSKIDNNLERLDEIQTIEETIAGITGDISDMESEFNEFSDMMKQRMGTNSEIIKRLETNIRKEIEDLSQKIAFTDQGIVEKIKAAESGTVDLHEYVRQREIYAAGAMAGLVLLIMIVALMSVASRRKAAKIHRIFEQKNHEMNQKIEEQGVVLDTRLVELMEKQIPLLSGADIDSKHPGIPGAVQALDHSLAIVLGEEIYRIMKRNKELSEKSILFEELKTSLRKLWTAFREKGYEVIDLQGKKYHEEMEAKAEFFLTHELLPGEQVVSKVITPIIRHNGVTIQKAEIEVMVGE